jgi:hypothetical protein
VERRDASLDDGFDRLCQAMTTDLAERLCAVIMSQLVGHEQVHDDIAILTVSREAAARTTG